MVRAFLAAVLSAAMALAANSSGHAQAQPPGPAVQSIGSVATVQGSATVLRSGGTAPLKVSDDIFKGDVLQTGPNAAVAVTLDDETTFTLGAGARMEMNDYVYQSGTAKNSAAYNVLRGTVAFVAGQVAKTGDMKIATPTATIGIRGTTGVIDVPENATTAGQVGIKLYQDANGAVGRIEVFAPGPGGARLGVLTRAATGFGIRAGGPGRFAAVPLQISPQEAARDRGVVQRLFTAHQAGRRLIIQRRTLRQQNQPPRNLRQPNQQRQPGQQLRPNPPGQQLQPNPQRLPGLQQQRPNLQRLPNLQRGQLRPRGRNGRDQNNQGR